MDLNTFQKKATETAVFDDTKAIEYLALGLAGEAGEVANKCKKIVRGDSNYQNPDYVKAILVGELGDVLWYLAVMADHLGISLDDVGKDNIDKIMRRKLNGTTKGDGDER